MTKTRIGNHLRRHMLGDQPTFRQGFKEGVAFASKHAPARKPLTTEQITAGIDIDSLSAAEIAAFHAGIRWAEEQHGIEGEA